ncbi:MAG: glycosyltransferase [Chthonomonas sp.]|nr:glycosyltransferase [Chthonomonas sp.]
MGLNVAIFEPEADGHHLALYTRTIIRTLNQRGHRVHLVTTERSTKHEAFQALVDDGLAFETHLMPDSPTKPEEGDAARLIAQFRRRWNYHQGYLDLVRREKIDSIYMVNIDQADLAIAVKGSPFGKTPFAGMLIGRQFHAGNKLRDRIFRPVFRRLLKLPRLRKLLILDGQLVEYVRSWKGAEKVVHSPDVGYLANTGPNTDPRSELGLPKDAFLVLAYGALSLRKGVAEVLAGTSLSEKACVVLAGRRDTEVEALLQGETATSLRSKGRLCEIKGFLDDRQESLAFHACDVVWLGYRNWLGMSGVLILAAIARKPVICHCEGLIPSLVKKYNLGLVIDISDSSAVKEAIDLISSNVVLKQEFAQAGPEFANLHTPQRFGDCIADAIESAANPNSSDQQ